MKNIYNLIIALLITQCLFSCNSESTTSTNQSAFTTQKIDATKFAELDTTKGKINFIYLENDSVNFLTQIDKIKFINNKIYILDVSGEHHLFQYTQEGKYIRTIGTRGRGTSKYLRLCDFDVAENGDIFLYDMQQMNMLIYNDKGELLAHKKTSFRAEAFNLLNDKKYLFSLSKDHQDKHLKNPKILVTDSTFKVEQEYFEYAKDFLDNKLTTTHFRESDAGILYNKPVNDSLILFDKSGKIVKAFQLDFGTSATPQDLKNDYEKLVRLRPASHYNYLYLAPFLTGDKILGNLFNGPQKAFFVYSQSTKIFKVRRLPDNFSYKNINLPITTIGDSIVVSYIDPQLYQFDVTHEHLNPKIKSFIENGGTVLTLYTYK